MGVTRPRPVEFGLREFRDALTARGLPASPEFDAIVDPGLPEAYAIEADKIIGGDTRGLMFGLLDAAEQIRTTGRLTCLSAAPKTPIRGLRTFVWTWDARAWFVSRDYWDSFFSMMARNRYNRFNLCGSAPPYPYMVDVPGFAGVRPQGRSSVEREQNLEALAYVSQSAADHGIDFTLGVWNTTVESVPRSDIGPFVYSALRAILDHCAGIRTVQMRLNRESGISETHMVELFGDYVCRAIADANHLVGLDARAWLASHDVLEAVRASGVPLRLSTKYWAEYNGRPYHPASIFPYYSYSDVLSKDAEGARDHDVFFEVWASGSQRLLLWGDPEFVRRAVPTFRLSNAAGFEIDCPLALKGWQDDRAVQSIFVPEEHEREFWNHPFERYWLFYHLWGRLGYDETAASTSWEREADSRFGKAGADVLTAYASASRVVSEIVAAHLTDPDFLHWPEVNPGGLLDEYRDVMPSDSRHIAGPHEAVANRLAAIPSAKQTPYDTAAILEQLASRTEAALESANHTLPSDHREWAASESDFRALALLARYHAAKQRAAYEVTWFDETGDRASIYTADVQLAEATSIWEQLVEVTEALYATDMSYGVDSAHWKDRLPYIYYDRELVRQRAATLDQYGAFVWGFDFSQRRCRADHPSPDYEYLRCHRLRQRGIAADYFDDPVGWQEGVEPRFTWAGPNTLYSDARGFGWESLGDRLPIDESRHALLGYSTLSTMDKHPELGATGLLFQSGFWGLGNHHAFKVKLEDGAYTVAFLHTDRTTTTKIIRAEHGVLRIAFPWGDWHVCGLVISTAMPASPPNYPRPAPAPRPMIEHERPESARAGEPLELAVRISPVSDVSAIRLHYRPLHAEAPFKTIEADLTGEAACFSILGSEISSAWDLLYYFEILNHQLTGWFEPDPMIATPYFVLPTLVS